MKFTPQFIDRVADANNIVDIISQHTQLKATGSGMMGRCPFPDHREKTPSFSVSETKQVYHCFGCGKSGNIYTFLRDFQGQSFPEAVEYLANRASLSLPLPESPIAAVESQAYERKKLLLKVNKQAQSFFVESLQQAAQDHPVRAYLQKRGIHLSTLEAFQIGYAPNEWEGLVGFLKGNNIPLDLAEEVQLLKAKNSGGYFDLFKDRLMFPIQSPLGDVLAFGGRILEHGQPKYLNSPESPVFTKGKVLYGLPQTAKFIRSEDLAIIVEGYMDLVSLYQAGIKNVVAIMGTALTSDHARLLKRLTRNTLVLLDGDSAGQAAAERALPFLLAADIYPKGLQLPEGLDPDDFVKSRGVDELQKQIKNAPDLVSLMIKSWLRDYRGEASQKVKFSDQLRGLLNQISDLRLRELYLVEGSQHLGVDLGWLKRSVFSPSAASGEVYPRNSRDSREGGSRPSFERNLATPMPDFLEEEASASAVESDGHPLFSIESAPSLEKTAMALSLKTRANFDGLMSEKGMEILTHPGVKNLLNFAKDVYGQDRNLFDKLISQLISKVDEPQSLFYRDASTAYTERREALASNDTEARDLKILRDTLKRLKETALRSQLKEIAHQLKLEPTPEKFEQLKRIQIEISGLGKSEEVPDRDI